MADEPSGADLANPLETMEAQLEASFGSLIPEVHRRWDTLRAAMTVVFGATGLLLFWLGGSTPGRLAAIAGCMAVLFVLNPRVAADLSARPAAERKRRLSWPAIGTVGMVLLGMALSGGLHSPLLPALPLSFVAFQVATGFSPTTRASAALIGVGVAAMSVAPRALVGPELAEPTFTLLLAMFTLSATFMNGSLIAEYLHVTEVNEAALRRLREQVLLQMCARTRDLEQVGASIGHELKNPLQAIKILVQLSAREAKEPDAQERLQVAAGEIEKMQTLISDYLSFSRPFDKLQARPVALGALADEVISLLAARAGSAGIELQRSGEVQIEGDTRRLREAVHNLIANAIEATPRGGSVVVEIGEREGAAHVAVRDTGAGMSRETLARIGTPFFTTRDDGNGLGVALVRAAITQHGGTLDYESEPGKGTTANVSLPKAQAQRSGDGARAGG
jgi:signal transduction histidine kinase